MTTYVALLDGGRREERLEVRRTGPGTYEVRLRGEVHAVDAFRHDHGTLSLLVDTESYTATLDERAGGAGRAPMVHVKVRGSVFPMELLGERKLRMRRAIGELTVRGRQEITAPLPGRVVRVLVKAGERVSAGQPLVVVEALRMENELRSPKDGRVIEVHVSDGEAVEANAKLCAVD